MADNYKLLSRLLVGVLKHQAKRYLGDDVVTTIAEAGSEHLGERLLEKLKREESTREQANCLEKALRSAAAELSSETGEVFVRLEETPGEFVEEVVDALANLEHGDLWGHRLQAAIQDLVAASAKDVDAEESLRLSIQLYQAVLMTVLTVRDLQPRAQDPLHQSRMWLLGEQVRRLERMVHLGKGSALGPSKVKDLPRFLTTEATGDESRAGKNRHVQESGLESGRLVADGSVELVKKLGQGGQGSVWQGTVLASGKSVAIKFLNDELGDEPEVVRSFKYEVHALQALSGDAFLRLVQPVTFEHGRYFFILELLESAMTLDQAFRSSKIATIEKIQYILNVADVVQDMHQQGFVHLDLKPDNIALEGPGKVVRLFDYGSMRRIGARNYNDPIWFTYAYAAPELRSLFREKSKVSNQDRMRVHAEVGPHLDIYSLGIVLFHALDPGLATTVLMEELHSLDKLVVKEELKDVIRTAIAHKPTDRYGSATDFKRALKDAVPSALLAPPI